MNILDRILDKIVGILIFALDLADFVRLYGERQTRRLLRFELQLSIFMISLFAFGMIMGWEWLIVSSAFFTSILGLFIWKQTEIALNALSALAGVKLEPDNKFLRIVAKPVTEPVELTQDVVRPVVEGMRGILMPLLTTSLAISFLASYVSIKGLDYFNLKDLMIYGTIILFLAIYFWAYLEVKTKIAGKVMFTWLLWLIAAHYLWPVQIQSSAVGLERLSQRWTISFFQKNEKGNKKLLPEKTPLWSFNHGNLSSPRETKTEVEVKVVGVVRAPNTNELMNKIILPVNGSYVGGEIAYISAESGKLVKETVGPKTDFVLRRGDVFTYKLGKGQATPWIEVPEGVTFNIAKKNFRVYYSNGHTPIDVKEKDVILPDVSPTKIKVGSHVPDNEITITGM